MQFFEHMAALEVAHDTMFGAISAARMDFIALYNKTMDRISFMYLRAWKMLARKSWTRRCGCLSNPIRFNLIYKSFFFLTLILRFLHRRHPARDFLCDRLGGIRRVPDSLVRLQRCSDDCRCATHWWHRHAGRVKGAFW
jgi:hypothetical protein